VNGGGGAGAAPSAIARAAARPVLALALALLLAPLVATAATPGGVQPAPSATPTGAAFTIVDDTGATLTLPAPPLPKFSLPGWRRISSSSSRDRVAGSCGLATSTCGATVTMDTGVKPFTGS